MLRNGVENGVWSYPPEFVEQVPPDFKTFSTLFSQNGVLLQNRVEDQVENSVENRVTHKYPLQYIGV